MCRAYVSKQLAQQLRPELEGAVKRMDSLGGSYSPDPASCAKRKLKNQALLLLSASGEPEILQELLLRQREASNMTDELAAVAALANTEGEHCSNRPICRHLDPLGGFKQWTECRLPVIRAQQSSRIGRGRKRAQPRLPLERPAHRECHACKFDCLGGGCHGTDRQQLCLPSFALGKALSICAAGSVRDTALEEFYAKWSHEDLAVLKWLRLKAGSNISGNVAAAQQLTQHPAFNIRNPSCCQALFGSFSKSAPNFHAADGSGYIFMADGLIKVNSEKAKFCSLCWLSSPLRWMLVPSCSKLPSVCQTRIDSACKSSEQ